MKGAAQVMSSARTGSGADDWRTPCDVLESVRLVGPIALDPCTTVDNPVGARLWITTEDDGLTMDWLEALRGDAAGPGLVYVNPPYSKGAAWAEKIVAEAAQGVEVVTLTAARTDTRWFYRLVWDTAQAVCFQRGRLVFDGALHGAPFPSAFVYHGPRPWAFEQAFHGRGRVVRLRESAR